MRISISSTKIQAAALSLVLMCGPFPSLLAAPAAPAAPAATTAPDRTVVVTDKGAVRGAIRNGVREFKGIPYAKPPVGPLRWSLPEPSPHLDGLGPWTAM